MTGYFDRLRIGKAPPNANAFANQPPQSGAPTSPFFIYTTTPATAANNQIVSNTTIPAGGTATLVAGSGASTVTIGGLTCIDLGGARVLQYLNNTASAVAAVITVSGYEETVLADGTFGPGQAMSEQVTMITTGNKVVNGKKAFRYIQTVFSATNTVSGISVGTTDNLGIPIIASNANDVEFFWNGAQQTTSTLLTLPDTTSPATATTGDVRGTFAPPSASTGTRALNAYIFVRNPDTLQGVYGVPQF